jgi:myo-inositol-1(or 4)-monophosphatase
MHLEQITLKACEAVRQAGIFIIGQAAHIHTIEIEEKSLNSLVSYVDKVAEQKLVESLQRITPGCGFLTEENTISIKGKEVEWIIDPLDGTTNFLYGIPAFSISIGLRLEEELVAGIIYEISRDEMFYAYQNRGAFLNNKTIHVSKRKELRHCLLATGFPYQDFSGINQYLNVLRQLMRGSRGLRRIGSAAIDLAYVACGRFDGFFEYNLNPWDVAGGTVIIQEAGGKVTDFAGGNNFLFGKEIIATNNLIHEELQTILKNNFLNNNPM